MPPKSRRLFGQDHATEFNEIRARCDSTQSHRALVREPESSHDFRAGAPPDESAAPSDSVRTQYPLAVVEVAERNAVAIDAAGVAVETVARGTAPSIVYRGSALR